MLVQMSDLFDIKEFDPSAEVDRAVIAVELVYPSISAEAPGLRFRNFRTFPQRYERYSSLEKLCPSDHLCCQK